MTQPSFRDLEILTAYLDGELDAKKSHQLESRLASDPNLAAALDELRATKALFRRLPQRRAPRNFTLTPKMAGIKPPLPRAYPVMRFATSFAAFLLFMAFTANFVIPLVSRQQNLAAAPLYGIGGGPESAMSERPMGGGGCDGCTEEVAAPAAEAPALAPETAAMPTATEIVAADNAVEPAPAEELRVEGDASQKSAEAPAQQQFSLAPLVIPPLWMGILLIVVVVFGAIALVIRLNTDFQWNKARGAGQVKLTRREIIVLAIAIAMLVAAAWGITALAKIQPVVVQEDTSLGGGEGLVASEPLPPGDKGSLPTVDKGNAPTVAPQTFKLTPDMGYGFSYMDTFGQTIAIDFPAGVVSSEADAMFTSYVSIIPPQDLMYYSGRGFTLVVFPKDLTPIVPITITFSYSDAESNGIQDESRFMMMWWNGDTWVDAETTCAMPSTYERLPDENKIRLNTCQFGTYILAGK